MRAIDFRGTQATFSGLQLFAHYAYPPNRLGYCGGSDHESLFGYLRTDGGDTGLTDLAKKFEGAYPYLQLIAGVNEIDDPFDIRVVEAYWIGNGLLEKVTACGFFASLRDRFRSRMTAREFGWLVRGLESGAKPHHNFHVFDVYRRAGLLRDAHAEIALDQIDRCRISWGRVAMVAGNQVLVERSPLEMRDGNILLGVPQTVTADGTAVAAQVRAGDIVSLHWGWVCARLSSGELSRLRANTKRALANTNATL